MVTAGAVTLGTFLTVFLVPAPYVLLCRYAGVPGENEAKLAQLEEDHPDWEQATSS